MIDDTVTVIVNTIANLGLRVATRAGTPITLDAGLNPFATCCLARTCDIFVNFTIAIVVLAVAYLLCCRHRTFAVFGPLTCDALLYAFLALAFVETTGTRASWWTSTSFVDVPVTVVVFAVIALFRGWLASGIGNACGP
jgi:hypothetical protein